MYALQVESHINARYIPKKCLHHILSNGDIIEDYLSGGIE